MTFDPQHDPRLDNHGMLPRQYQNQTNRQQHLKQPFDDYLSSKYQFSDRDLSQKPRVVEARHSHPAASSPFQRVGGGGVAGPQGESTGMYTSERTVKPPENPTVLVGPTTKINGYIPNSGILREKADAQTDPHTYAYNGRYNATNPRQTYPSSSVESRDYAKALPQLPHTYQNIHNLQQYSAKEWHSSTKESKDTSESLTQKDKEENESDGDDSDLDDPLAKRVQASPEVRAGIVGFLLILLAACFLVLPVVVSADPWQSLQGYMIAGLVLLCVGILLIIANVIWCKHTDKAVATLVKKQFSIDNKLQRPAISRPHVKVEAKHHSDVNNNRQESKGNVPVSKSSTLSSPTIGQHKAHPDELRRENDYVRHNGRVVGRKAAGGFQNSGYRGKETEERSSNSQGNSLNTAFVQPKTDGGNKDNGVKPSNEKNKKKGRRKNKKIEYPRTSTRKDLVTPDQSETDSAPENLNATALRQKLSRDPRFTSMGYFNKAQSMGSASADSRENLDFRGTVDPQRPRIQSDYSVNYRANAPTPMDSGYAGSVGDPTQDHVRPVTEHARPTSEYIRTVSGYSDHRGGEGSSNPHTPWTPSQGLLDIARESYSNYIHGVSNDLQTKQGYERSRHPPQDGYHQGNPRIDSRHNDRKDSQSRDEYYRNGSNGSAHNVIPPRRAPPSDDRGNGMHTPHLTTPNIQLGSAFGESSLQTYI